MNQSRANNVGTVFSFLALTVRIPLLVCWVFFFCGSARHELAGGLIETHHSIGSVMIASQSSTSQRSIGPHSGGGMRPLGKKKYSVNGNTVTTCQWPSAGARVWPFNGGQRSARNAQKKTTKKNKNKSANGRPMAALGIGENRWHPPRERAAGSKDGCDALGCSLVSDGVLLARLPRASRFRSGIAGILPRIPRNGALGDSWRFRIGAARKESVGCRRGHSGPKERPGIPGILGKDDDDDDDDALGNPVPNNSVTSGSFFFGPVALARPSIARH